MQLQGVQWSRLPPNIPTVNDVPFALGPDVLHRYDFGNADQVCLHVMGDYCIRHDTTNFDGCALRCWGKTYDPPTPFEHGWTYPKQQGLPQGRVFTFAGDGTAGYQDGLPGEVSHRLPRFPSCNP